VLRDETLTEEHARLLRRTKELSRATDKLSLPLMAPFDRGTHEALAAELREHQSDLRAHTERQKRAHHLRQL
jgi:hypothetical protein